MTFTTSALCQLIVDNYIPISTPNNEYKEAYYRCLAAQICLLEKVRSIGSIAREEVCSLTGEQIQNLLKTHSILDNESSDTIQKLKNSCWIFLTATNELDKPYLQSCIYELDKTIATGPKKLGGPSYYSQLHKKLMDFHAAIEEFEIIMPEVQACHHLVAVQEKTPLESQQKTTPTSRTYAGQLLKNAGFSDSEINVFSEKQVETLVFDCVFFYAFVQEGMISLTDAMEALEQYSSSALSSSYIRTHVREKRLTIQEALDISLEQYENSAVSLTALQPLFSEGRWSIAEGLVTPKETFTPSFLLETDPELMTLKERCRRGAFLAYHLLEDREDDVEPHGFSVWDINLYYVELMVLLECKENKTPGETLELTLLREKRMPNHTALRIAELTYKEDKTVTENREFDLICQYGYTHDLIINTYKSAVIQQILQKEEEFSTQPGNTSIKKALTRLYFDLCCKPPLPFMLTAYIGVLVISGFSPCIDPVMNGEDKLSEFEKLFERISQSMNFKFKALIYYYLQEVSGVPTQHLSPLTTTMQQYITEKMELLRLGTFKYFVDKGIDFCETQLTQLAQNLREMMRKRELTLNDHQKIFSLVDYVHPVEEVEQHENEVVVEHFHVSMNQ